MNRLTFPSQSEWTKNESSFPHGACHTTEVTSEEAEVYTVKHPPIVFKIVFMKKFSKIGTTLQKHLSITLQHQANDMTTARKNTNTA